MNKEPRKRAAVLEPAQLRVRSAGDDSVIWEGASHDFDQELDAVRRRLAQLTAVVESSDDAVIGKDVLGLVTSWNRGAERMYGYASSEMLGRTLDVLLPVDRAGEIERLHGEVVMGRTIDHFSTQRLSKSGKLVDVSLTIFPIRDSRGNVIGISSIARDVTEQKQMERQFAQIQKLEAIGRLAGGIAHDFNNILGIIGGNQELLQRSALLHPDLKRWTDEIGKAAKRAAGLTRQLLAFGRNQLLRPEVLNLNSVISKMSSMLEPLLGEDIDLQVFSDPTLARVLADRSQIEQVILNLAVNARDAMPDGGRLQIETMNVDLDKDYASRHVGVRPGKYVMMAVTDTGVGIPTEIQSRVFEPFFTTKELGKGTGLGLSTVYGIVKQSGGNIWLYSELGHGTCFKVYLPQAEEEETISIEPKPAKEVPRGSGTILLVEDQAPLRKVLAEHLRDGGYDVYSAANPEEAMSLAEQQASSISLLVTDVVLPRLKGDKLYAQLRDVVPKLKVIYCSGYTSNSIVQEGILDPGASFLQKPFTRDALLAMVWKVMKDRSQ